MAGICARTGRAGQAQLDLMRYCATLEAPRLAAKTEKGATKSIKIQILLFLESVAANQNQKFPFHFLSAPPHPRRKSKERKENFWFCTATEGSGRGAISPFVQNEFAQR